LILVAFSTLQTQSSWSVKNDYIFLNKILDKVKKQNPNKDISLCSSDDNRNIVSIIENLKKYEIEKKTYKLDSLKQELGITKDSVFLKIFNPNEYNNLINQKQNTEWDFKKIKVKNVTNYVKNDFTSKGVRVGVSKPIYTSNKKFALVSVSISNSSCILVFKKNKTSWEEYKLIDPWFN
jgi:cobalamin biosynthesis Co2+ chelatase CbiK